MDRLTPVVFSDAWGSRVSIASLQGRDIPSPEPESELWMGAHEAGASGTDRPGNPDLDTMTDHVESLSNCRRRVR